MMDPLNQPALSPPVGQTSNLVDPSNDDLACFIGLGVVLVCTTLIVWIRLYVAVYITQNVRWDDYLVLLTWLLYIIQLMIGVPFIQSGASVDMWNLSLGRYQTWLRWTYFWLLAYSVTIFCIKLAILLLYKRIFVPSQLKGNRTYWTIMTVIIFNAMYYTANFFVTAFFCTPIKKYWIPSTLGTCVNVDMVFVFSAGINVASDACILIIPLAIVWNLNLPRRRKAEIIYLFACGGFCVLSSAMRLTYSVVNLTDTDDTISFFKVALWSAAEETSCFLASCIPMIPRFVNHFRSKTRTKRMKLPGTYFHGRRNRLSTSFGAKPSVTILSTLREPKLSRQDPYYLDFSQPQDQATFDEVELTTVTPTTTSMESVEIMVSRSWDVESIPENILAGQIETPSAWPVWPYNQSNNCRQNSVYPW